jgi:hypothetical protein
VPQGSVLRGGTPVKKLALLVVACSAFAVLLALPVLAEEETISASVTPLIIDITVSDGAVSYGTLSPGGTRNTLGSDSQRITNQSNVPVDIRLRSSDADDINPPIATDWALTGCASVGTDTFGHQYDIDGNGTFTGLDFPSDPSFANAYTAVVKTLDEAGGLTTDAFLELGICMPTLITNVVPHYMKVTVQATAP